LGSIRRKCIVLGQKLAVLAREDVVGDSGNAIACTEGLA